jgi:hypothetical protein
MIVGLVALAAMTGGVAGAGVSAGDSQVNSPTDVIVDDTVDVELQINITDFNMSSGDNATIIEFSNASMALTDRTTVTASNFNASGGPEVNTTSENTANQNVTVTVNGTNTAATKLNLTVTVTDVRVEAGATGDDSRKLSVVLDDADGETEVTDTGLTFNVNDRKGGEVETDGTVFQGETVENVEDAAFVPEAFTNSNDDVLDNPIPEAQPTGSYTDNTNTLIVRSPEISSLEIKNPQGEDVAGGTLLNSELAEVAVDYNYQVSENLTLTVSEGGSDVTQEVLAEGNTSSVYGGNSGQAQVRSSTVADGVSFYLDFTGEVGTYDITVEGADDLDFGDATALTTSTSVTPPSRPPSPSSMTSRPRSRCRAPM